MCIRMYAFRYIYVFTNVDICILHIFITHTWIYTCIFVYVYICVYIHVRICIDSYICMNPTYLHQTQNDLLVYICVTYMFVYIYICICIYIYI